MDQARKLDLRLLLAAAAIVSVAVAMWASGALAAGGSSSSGDSSGNGALIQSGDDGQAPRRDCPKDRGGSSGSGGTQDGSDAPSL
jgi:hypothetical protein